MTSIRPAGYWMMIQGLSLVAGLGCKDLTGNQQLPAGTSDPASYNTPAGAMAQRNAAINAFLTALPLAVVYGGALSDELVVVPCQDHDANGGVVNCTSSLSRVQKDLDQRRLVEGNANTAVSHPTDEMYTALHRARGLAGQAIGQLATYAPTSPPSVRGELYAVAGYAEMLLADLFCSGVPLSTLDFQNDYTYQPSSTTTQVYQHAIALFDSALVLSADSARILNLARVGKGRALLDLGDYAQAAQAVHLVPDDYRYQLSVRWRYEYGLAEVISNVKEADREGGNGLSFLLSGDPRSAGQLRDALNGPLPLPAKILALLNGAGYAPLTLADGTEARLIQAEAALHGIATGSGSWLDQLNYLRANGVVPGLGTPAPDQLPPLAMPNADSARVALIFQERAEWLFATGHRQGDLRRQLREYSQYWLTQNTLYPVGVYLGGGFYGNDVTAPIPAAEFTNPLYHGCLDRDA